MNVIILTSKLLERVVQIRKLKKEWLISESVRINGKTLWTFSGDQYLHGDNCELGGTVGTLQSRKDCTQ